MRRLSALLLALLAACGPLNVIPGGELAGSTQPAPTDWGFSDAVRTVQLETRPADPYSVNVWGVGLGSHFYVFAADRESRWAAYIAEDPRVRLRVRDDVFALRATRTENPSELDAFHAALDRKYDYELDADERSQALIFRLEAR